jgi:hypothetical protein
VGFGILLEAAWAAQSCQSITINPTAGLCNGKVLTTKGCYDGSFPSTVLDSLKGLADSAGSATCRNFFSYDYCGKISSFAKVSRSSLWLNIAAYVTPYDDFCFFRLWRIRRSVQ